MIAVFPVGASVVPSQLIFALNMALIGAPRHDQDKKSSEGNRDTVVTLCACGMWFGTMCGEGMGSTALRC